MLVLFGAGNCGRSIARNLKEPFVFVDNNPDKWMEMMMGVEVYAPEEALVRYPNETWVIAIGKPERSEVARQLAAMGVEFEMPWEYLDMKFGLPSIETGGFVVQLAGDTETVKEVTDQFSFRTHPDYGKQRPCSNLEDIYFPAFIAKRDDEHFVDCGAADGDTVHEFRKRWKGRYARIRAFEPDAKNYRKLAASTLEDERTNTVMAAVSDRAGLQSFTATGDYSSHLGGKGDAVQTYRLDDMLVAPTFIKMDIEGSELEALWGARRILKEHSPVLAICAYHKSEDLWQIPLLIHALQPNYKLFLRRYSPGTLDLVWYAVPPERIVHE